MTLSGSSSPADLLRMLGSGVRPDGASAPSARSPLESRGFDELLRAAGAGDIRSGRLVSVDPTVQANLSMAQRDALGEALDEAEASGAQTLLAVIDGESFLVDVESRSVERQLDGVEAALTTVDAAVTITTEDASESGEGEAPLPRLRLAGFELSADAHLQNLNGLIDSASALRLRDGAVTPQG